MLLVHAGISYLQLIKKIRRLFIVLVILLGDIFVFCMGIIFIVLSVIFKRQDYVFNLGIFLTILAAGVLFVIFSQRLWMKIFDADKLLEKIAKYDETAGRKE